MEVRKSDDARRPRLARVGGMERMELGGLHSGESVASAALMAADRARMLGFQPGAENLERCVSFDPRLSRSLT